MNKLARFDKELFNLINGKWHNDFFDAVMPFLRNANFWLPLYLFLFLFVLSNFRKNAWWWIFFFAGTVILANFISSNVIREIFFRLRPCNDPAMADNIRVLVNYRPQSSGFISSHAANHFAMAAFLYLTLKDYIGKWGLLFFLWAFIIVYAQVYVGVHYPFDILRGTLIGFVFGYLSAKAFNKTYNTV